MSVSFIVASFCPLSFFLSLHLSLSFVRVQLCPVCREFVEAKPVANYLLESTVLSAVQAQPVAARDYEQRRKKAREEREEKVGPAAIVCVVAAPVLCI